MPVSISDFQLFLFAFGRLGRLLGPIFSCRSARAEDAIRVATNMKRRKSGAKSNKDTFFQRGPFLKKPLGLVKNILRIFKHVLYYIINIV